jgi:hypothetical protein
LPRPVPAINAAEDYLMIFVLLLAPIGLLGLLLGMERLERWVGNDDAKVVDGAAVAPSVGSAGTP